MILVPSPIAVVHGEPLILILCLTVYTHTSCAKKCFPLKHVVVCNSKKGNTLVLWLCVCVRGEITDRIVFTCTVTGSGALLWAVESLFSFNELITFNVFDHEPGTVPDQFPEVFNVTLVNSVQNSTQPR